jgi:hypothetical protein
MVKKEEEGFSHFLQKKSLPIMIQKEIIFACSAPWLPDFS